MHKYPLSSNFKHYFIDRIQQHLLHYIIKLIGNNDLYIDSFQIMVDFIIIVK